MSVVANKVGNNAVVTITVDITAILANSELTVAEKKQQAMQMIQDEFNRAVDASQYTDAAIDQRAASITALKAFKITGNL